MCIRDRDRVTTVERLVVIIAIIILSVSVIVIVLMTSVVLLMIVTNSTSARREEEAEVVTDTEMERQASNKEDAQGAVSYTHLDVYKRQELRLLSN